jgi:hypothetical protein
MGGGIIDLAFVAGGRQQSAWSTITAPAGTSPCIDANRA